MSDPVAPAPVRITLTADQKEAAWLLDAALVVMVRGGFYSDAALECAIWEIEAAARAEDEGPSRRFLTAAADYLRARKTERARG